MSWVRVALAFLLWNSSALWSQQYTISTLAGGGLPVNVPGTSAFLPTYAIGNTLAADAVGNTFIVSRDVVLRLDATTGLLTLVAGNGTQGFSGDNGPATNAQFYDPTGIAVDSSGNIYIVDDGNTRIRKVSNGVITTVAGNGTRGFSGDNGPATSAQFDGLLGVAADSSGNIYIADGNNNRVRKVSNGVITTVAGNGTAGFSGDGGLATNAQLSGPVGLTVDSSGNIYILDSFNNRVRKVSNGVITTVAGNGTAGLTGDNGPATSAQLDFAFGAITVDSSGNVYIADHNNNRIRRVSNGVITSAAGSGTCIPSASSPCGFGGDGGPATSAQLNLPVGVALDSSGNIYIADQLNSRIRKVSGLNGVINTIAGGGQSVGDSGPATRAQLDSPEGVAIDSSGNIYIADGLDNRIRKVSNGVIATVAGNGTQGFSGDNGPATSAQLNATVGQIAMDSTGNLYIADVLNNRVRKVSNGVITTVAGDGTDGFSGDNGPATSAQLSGPWGLAVDLSGNIYIADAGNGRVRKVSNAVITTIAGGGSSFGDNGPATGAQLANPIGVTVDSAGNLYIADFSRVRKVSNGVITTVAGNGTPGFSGDNGPATNAQLFDPGGIALDSLGNLYIADNNRVRKVSNGVIATIAGGGSTFGDNVTATGAQLNQPGGVGVDSSGNVYIADSGDNRVRLLTPIACTYSVSPTSLQSSVSGGNLAISIQTTSACSWTVSGLPSWITVSGASSGSGLATVMLVIAANTGVARSANASIAGISVLVSQQGALPSLSLTAVNNAASNLLGPVAPGEIVTITGSGLGPAQITLAHVGSDGLYDAQLASTSVQFNGIPAPMIYTSAAQVAAIVPYEVTGSSAQVTVTYQGQTSTPLTVGLAPSAPGLFTLDSTGKGQAAAVNQNNSINGAAAPAPIGSIISLYATGEGQTSPSGVDGKPASVTLPTPNLPVNVTIGGVTVNGLQYVGGAPGEVAGLLQINVLVPAGIAPGNAVPVVIRVGAATSQAGVTIAVR